MKKKFSFLTIAIFIFFINSLMTFSERVINNLGQLEERNGKTYIRGEKEAFTGTLNVYRDGNWLFSEVPFKNGLRDGVQKDYYKSGKLRWSDFFKNGKREGLYKRYYRSGKLELEMPYKDGKENGKSKQYWENGNIMNEATYKNGVLDGPQKVYHENGVLKLEMTLKDERPIGDVLTYDEKGKLIGKERY